MLHRIEIAVQKICLAATHGLLRKSSRRKKRRCALHHRRSDFPQLLRL